KLGRLHLYPFASKRYIELYGLPKSVDEVRQHRIIDQKAPQVEENFIPRLLNIPSIEGIVAFRTNTSTAHAYAIDLGMGIGALPTYVMTLGTDLVPVDIGVRHQLDIWMTYHPDARSVRRVSVFIDWLRTLFDPRRHPWFADDFIHPRDLIGTAPPADISATSRTLVPAPARAAKAAGRPPNRQKAAPAARSRPDTPLPNAQPNGAQTPIHGGQPPPGDTILVPYWGLSGGALADAYEVQDQEHDVA